MHPKPNRAIFIYKIQYEGCKCFLLYNLFMQHYGVILVLKLFIRTDSNVGI